MLVLGLDPRCAVTKPGSRRPFLAGRDQHALVETRAMLAPNEGPMPATRFAIPPPVLSSPALLEATAGEEVTLPLHSTVRTECPPWIFFIAMSGLPQGSTLSTGRPYGEGEWNLKTDEIGDLQLRYPAPYREWSRQTHISARCTRWRHHRGRRDGYQQPPVSGDGGPWVRIPDCFSHLFGLRPLAITPAATATAGDTRV